MKLLLTMISFSLILSQQLQVDGNLKVTGEIDAQGQAIKNVGIPTLTTDAANAQYVNERTAGKGKIITLKCPWIRNASNNGNPGIGNCELPECPAGYTSLSIFNEIVSISTASNNTVWSAGNEVRYCIEDEE